jgi:hypothetical protein
MRKSFFTSAGLIAITLILFGIAFANNAHSQDKSAAPQAGYAPVNESIYNSSK